MKFSGNKALPILAGLVILSVTVLVVLLSSSKTGQQEIADNPDQRHIGLDGDMPEHTLNKLATDMAEFKDLLKGNKELVSRTTDEYDQLRREIKILKERDRKLTQQLAEDKNHQRASNREKIDVSAIAQQVLDRIKPELKADGPTRSTKAGLAHSYPVNDSTDVAQVSQATRRIRAQNVAQPVVPDKAKDLLPDFMYPPPLGTVGTQAGKPGQGIARQDHEPPPVPIHTIPDMSILDGATTVTHLIGRVPIKGDVTDPAPFKIVLGKENLAANGHTVPGIEGMIMEGYVWGDATLSCVRAYINSASYIFQDGRIVSHRNRNTKGGRSEGALAYLTDEFGSTCIPGEYITNAPRVLTANFLADLAAGAAEAYAENETTSIVNSSGGVTSAVTGRSGKYVLGKALSSGTNSVADYIRLRNLDVWDSVLVRAGLRVAVHLQQDLPIDYDKHARKISYRSHNNRQGLMD